MEDKENKKSDSVTIKAVRKNGHTTISNDRGDKWSCLGNMPERYSIAALVTYTLCTRLDNVSAISDDFEITMNIKLLNE